MYESSLALKTLPQALKNISLIQVKPLKLHLPWPLSLHLAARRVFDSNGSHCRHFSWLDGLSTASVDSLHSTLKAVTRPLDIRYKKAAFQDNESP